MGGKIKLFFDFNGLLHTVVNESEQFELKDNKILFPKMVEYYNHIVDFIKPDFVMVAIDGVCPRAKMIQQRIRRYKTAQNRTDLNAFDRNSISPGTKWMKELCIYLKNFFDTQKNVIFYGADIPGEGEHTIFKYIRNDKKLESTRYVVYGLDADLIMLSIVSGKDDIYLLRERQEFEQDYIDKKKMYNFLDINELKYGLVKFTETEYYIKIRDVDQYLDDFVFFTFLLGNDFVPHLNSLSINNFGIELLIENYIKVKKITNSNLVSKKFMKININMLNTMLKDIVQNENKLIIENNKKIRIQKQQQLNYYNRNWKSDYYYHFFFTNSPQYIDKICDKYCKILNWTFKYYFKGCPSWRFSYNFRAPPCLSDIYKYLSKIDLNSYNFYEDIPYTQNQQLMMVLPPKSRKLFPEKYVKLIDNELVDFYPLNFQLEVVDKHVEWMHTPIIPEINDKTILYYVKD